MLEINDTAVGAGRRPYIIAEVGINAYDDVRLAKRFVEIAADCGADAVKFQTHLPDAEMHESAMRAVDSGDVYDTVVQCEWSRADHRELRDHAAEHGITFLSTPFSAEAVDLLNAIDVPAIKIGSGEMTNYHLLERAASTGRPLIVSTGMSTLSQVRDAATFLAERTDKFALLYCVSSYPATADDFDFGTLGVLGELTDGPVGFSDHSPGVDAAKIAIGHGADIVEKHFTLDRALPGPDQVVSIEPDELADLCSFATLAHETASTRDRLQSEEKEVKRWARHSLVTTDRVAGGETFSQENLTTKRPGTGVPATEYFEVLGTEATSDLSAGAILSEDDIA
jgi:N-acetylneuraminate synthase/N,N'-diacetyllegionaminate synthase